MPLDTVKFNFLYGATGSSSSNTIDTIKHNKVCYKLRNFVPRKDGSVFKRQAIKNISGDGTLTTPIRRYLAFNKDPNKRRANLVLFVHSPAPDVAIPAIIIGPYHDGQSFYPSECFLFSDKIDPQKDTFKLPWMPDDVAGHCTIKELVTSTVFTHEDLQPTYAQLITSKSNPAFYELYMQPIVFKKGPCGPRDYHRTTGVQSWYKWIGLNGAGWYEATVPTGFINQMRGEDILLRFHPDYKINLNDYLGYTFAINHPVEMYDPFGAPKNYENNKLVSHGKNLYFCVDGYNAAALAPPPTHTEDFEIVTYSDGNLDTQHGDHTKNTETGRWQYVNSSVCYIRLIEIRQERGVTFGRFQCQKGVPPFTLSEDMDSFLEDVTWPFLQTLAINLPAMGPGIGYPSTHGAIFQGFALGGGREAYQPGTDADFNEDLERNSVAYISERGDFENFDEYEGLDTSAVSLQSSDGSAIRDIIFIDAKTSGIVYDTGFAILSRDDAGKIALSEAAPANPAKKPYGGKFGVYLCCIGEGNDSILGSVYRYENNTYVTYTLTEPLYSILEGVKITRLLYPRGTPEKVLILRDDGIVTVMYIADSDNNVGFFDIETSKFILDVDYHGSDIYLFMIDDEFNEAWLGKLNIEKPATYDSSHLSEFGKPVEAVIEIGRVSPPMNASQETWISADRIRSVRIEKTAGSVLVNGNEAKSSALNDVVNIRDTDANKEVPIRVEAKTAEPLSIMNLEIAYKRKTLVGNQ